MRTLQRVGAGLFALTLFVGLAACGDDDDADEGTEATDGEDDGEQAAGASDEFCDAVVEFNAAATSSEVGNPESTEDDIVAAGEEMAPMTQTLADEAPDDLADDAGELNTVVEALLEGDAEGFQADSTIETYMGFLAGASEACEFASVAVEGRDYAFDAPDTIAAGTTAFEFTNVSDAEPHEMLIMQRADGVTQSFEEIFSLPEEEAGELAQFVTATFAEPGGEGSALVDLEPGDYAMVCFVPVGGGEEGPPHFTEGMLHEFTVE